MATEEKTSQQKTLEMRVAALEDKLSKLNITEEEMKAYEKVSALMGMGAAPGAAATTPQLSPQVCSISRQRVVFCWPRGVIRPIITVCECTCGPCACEQTGGGFGGGFGSFGM